MLLKNNVLYIKSTEIFIYTLCVTEQMDPYTLVHLQEHTHSREL